MIRLKRSFFYDLTSKSSGLAWSLRWDSDNRIVELSDYQGERLSKLYEKNIQEAKKYLSKLLIKL